MKIKPQRLSGNWKGGIALDLHTVSSILRPDKGFDTTRTEVGDALFRLKYRSDKSKIGPLAHVASDFLKTRKVISRIAVIIPVPPSEPRRFQPVNALAKAIGRRLRIAVEEKCLVKTRKTRSLKEIAVSGSRQKELKGAFKVLDKRFAGKKVLLFDDLYRSGETLSEIAKVLYDEGDVAEVYVFTITKTRSKR